MRFTGFCMVRWPACVQPEQDWRRECLSHQIWVYISCTLVNRVRAAHTSKRGREEPDSEAEDMAGCCDSDAHPAASVHAHPWAPAGAAAGATGKKQQRAADAADELMEFENRNQGAGVLADGDAAAAEESAVPPPSPGDCMVFVSAQSPSVPHRALWVLNDLTCRGAGFPQSGPFGIWQNWQRCR